MFHSEQKNITYLYIINFLSHDWKSHYSVFYIFIQKQPKKLLLSYWYAIEISSDHGHEKKIWFVWGTGESSNLQSNLNRASFINTRSIVFPRD